jgi:hypothetical protein
MRSRVRFPVLPWEFSLTGRDSHSDHGLGSLLNLGLRSLLVLYAHTYHHSHHRGNVSVPYGRPQSQKSVTLRPQPGRGTTKSIWTCGGTGGEYIHIYVRWRVLCCFYSLKTQREWIAVRYLLQLFGPWGRSSILHLAQRETKSTQTHSIYTVKPNEQNTSKFIMFRWSTHARISFLTI